MCIMLSLQTDNIINMISYRVHVNIMKVWYWYFNNIMKKNKIDSSFYIFSSF